MSRLSTLLLVSAAALAVLAFPAADASAQSGAPPPPPNPPPWWPFPVLVWYAGPGPAPRPAPSPAPPPMQRPAPAPAIVGPAITPSPAAAPLPTQGVVPQGTAAWPDAWARMEDEVFMLTNQRRAQGAVCGGTSYAPAGPLMPDAVLRSAAREHSRDMGAGNYFEHVSLDGRSPTDRMRAAGWSGRMSGENIYGGEKNGGTLSAAEVVEGWMESPGHCANIMNPRFKTIGVGYAATPRSRLGNYWTQDFGG